MILVNPPPSAITSEEAPIIFSRSSEKKMPVILMSPETKTAIYIDCAAPTAAPSLSFSPMRLATNAVAPIASPHPNE